MEIENDAYLLQGQILDSKRVILPAEMFWILEKENIYPKESRALRLVLMYYWDKIAHYSNVEDFRLLDTEPITYYYAVKRALDSKEGAFMNDMYNIWRVIRALILELDFSNCNVNREEACKVYDFMMSQLKSYVYNQKIEIFDWYRQDYYYDESNKVIEIITNVQKHDTNTCFRKWPYRGAIAYYWNLMFNNLIELKDFNLKVCDDCKVFKQHYERWEDTDFINFQIMNINQNYSSLRNVMEPREIEFIKDVLYALGDKKRLRIKDSRDRLKYKL